MGPYEPVGRIRPVLPGPSLLTAARTLPDGVNWSTGISWSASCQPSYSWEDCPDLEVVVGIIHGEGDPGDIPIMGPNYKTTPEDNTVAQVMPFTIYTPFFCGNVAMLNDDAETYITTLNEVHTANQLADTLWMGTGYRDDDLFSPTLRRAAQIANHDLLDLDDGIATLLTHYQLCTGGSGGAMIHMPGSLLTGALGGGSGGARICWPEGNVYRGPHGCTVVAGPGYPEGFSPDGPDGHGPQLDPDLPNTYLGNEQATAWVYVTGPVEYAVTPVRAFPETRAERMVEPRMNFYGFFGEREAIVRFDPCCTFAVEVINPAPMPEVS